jgi:DNA uptake protein ComE-like DNA-binding protein
MNLFKKFLAQQAIKGIDALERQLSPLSAKLRSDPYYRFTSPEELRLAVQLGVRIDANQASIDDWLRLPGISIHQARNLVGLTQAGVSLTCLEDVAAALGISPQTLQPMAPILQFCYYDPDSAMATTKIDVNQATVEQLVQVPTIDFHLARILIYHRQRNGAFQNLNDLRQRLKLSAQITSDLLHYLRF